MNIQDIILAIIILVLFSYSLLIRRDVNLLLKMLVLQDAYNRLIANKLDLKIKNDV